MARITGEPRWQQGADLAASFVEAMYDSSLGYYLAGTTDPDHRNANPAQLPLDVQAWRVLALPDVQGRVAQALAGAEGSFRVTSGGLTGFDFNSDRDGVWLEGTGQMAVAYAVAGRASDAAFYRGELREAQAPPAPPDGAGDGAMVAATANDQLTTGFDFRYFRRLHLGATSWAAFGWLGYNPYYQTYVSPPFELSLSSDSFSIVEGQAAVEIQVVRTGAADTAVSVRVETIDVTAKAGVDYEPIGMVVTLQPGETSRRIPIVIRAPGDGHWNPERQFRVRLSDVQGDGLPQLGAVSSASIAIRDDDPPPRLAQVGRVVVRRRLVRLDAEFDQPLNPKSARNLKNFIVQPVGTNRRIGVRLSYVPGSKTVRIRLRTPLPAARLVRLTVIGQAPSGVTNLAPDLLDGDSDGRPGGDAVRIV